MPADLTYLMPAPLSHKITQGPQSQRGHSVPSVSRGRCGSVPGGT